MIDFALVTCTNMGSFIDEKPLLSTKFVVLMHLRVVNFSLTSVLFSVLSGEFIYRTREKLTSGNPTLNFLRDAK
jgi:hypothetical protein